MQRRQRPGPQRKNSILQPRAEGPLGAEFSVALKKEGVYRESSWASDFHIAVPTEIKSSRPSSLPFPCVSFFKGLPAHDTLLQYLGEEKKGVVGGITGFGVGWGCWASN